MYMIEVCMYVLINELNSQILKTCRDDIVKYKKDLNLERKTYEVI